MFCHFTSGLFWLSMEFCNVAEFCCWGAWSSFLFNLFMSSDCLLLTSMLMLWISVEFCTHFHFSGHANWIFSFFFIPSWLMIPISYRCLCLVSWLSYLSRICGKILSLLQFISTSCLLFWLSSMKFAVFPSPATNCQPYQIFKNLFLMFFIS